MNAAQFVANVPIPLSREVLDKADALIETADRFPEFSVTRATRTSILRLAILRGLDQLEQEAKRRTVSVTGRSPTWPASANRSPNGSMVKTKKK